MSRYLIDTNILSEPIRPQPTQIVVETMRRYTNDIAIASVTWHEILFGCRRLPPSRRRETLEQYLEEVQNTPEAAAWHASERARLTAIGQPPAFQDGQIAATAHVNNLILVTNNVSDYANFQNLAIKNWFTP